MDGDLLLWCLPAVPPVCPQSHALEDFQEDCSYPNKCLEKSPEELPWGLCSNGAIQGGRCKTWPPLSEHKLWQHLQVVSHGGIAEVHIAKTFQCGMTARTISKVFRPVLSPA